MSDWNSHEQYRPQPPHSGQDNFGYGDPAQGNASQAHSGLGHNNGAPQQFAGIARTALIFAIASLAAGVFLAWLQVLFYYIGGAGGVPAAFSAVRLIVTLGLAITALVLGIQAVRKGFDRLQAGIAIGISGGLLVQQILGLSSMLLTVF
ncbi:MAG: hypothetical protein ACTHXA_00825 [Gulosibacter sp.]|uniref:hypothetical protein n=1 Tax=Gulosibacter sp. TaxID=2817531 RepID=UPI003F8FF6AC